MNKIPAERFNAVLRATCSYYRVKHNAVLNIGRLGKSPTEEARMVVCYLLREYGYNYTEIGITMGYTNHTGPLKNVSVITGILEIEKNNALNYALLTIGKKIEELYPAMQGRQLTILD